MKPSFSQSFATVSLLLGLLGWSLISPPPAMALSRQCRWLRQIRQITIHSGSTSRRILELEYDYCQGRRRESRPDTRSDCFHLTMMETLARTTGETDTGAIAAERVVACAFRDQRPRLPWRYANGQAVKLGPNWYYPNGETAKFGSRWRYANGQTATEGSTWRYPDGAFALNGDRGHLPGGGLLGRIDLLRWACSRVGSQRCETRLMAVLDQAEVVQDAAIVQLAWQASRY
ncbi:MAG: hypothetical protein AAGG51_15205 [Cyanobacteria bacterium P01_G01_bin.54]